MVRQTCALALGDLFSYLPLVGFVVRSTSVRNAFEVFRPFLRLASDVLEPEVPKEQRKTRLVLSSEWDYSPFVYPHIPDLPDFVLIGLPAPESSNPLLIPLAGHELGHSVWLKRKLNETFEPKLRQEVIATITAQLEQFKQVTGYQVTAQELTSNLFAAEAWLPALQWGLRQAEETFCDIIGLRLFGTSYLQSFAYLLSPNHAGPRSSEYPNMKRRVGNLIKAARHFSIRVPGNYDDDFEDFEEPDWTPADKFRLSVADQVLDRFVGDLTEEAGKAIDKANVIDTTEKQVERIYGRLRLAVPAEKTLCLADILNAAWRAYEDPNLWNDIPQIRERRHAVVKELVLKNIEVFEIEQILAG